MSKLLDEYRRKRSADRTPEPMGSGAARPGVFVVQKHSATRMHYDLRLEWDGVLKSWAVPRGPHPDPAEKRLAMQTEDHPVEYADFEGVIPDGEYGAGPMIVWDRGLWRPVGDPREGVKAGKLLFELKGFKLKGMWTLVRIKGETGKEWLLIKETGDGHVRRGVAEPYEDSSILSGLAVEELRDRGKRAAGMRAKCEVLKAPRNPVAGEDVQPMLAEPRSDPFDDRDWLFELKYDGFRSIVSRDGARPRIKGETGKEWLLIKETGDGHVRRDVAEPYQDSSILSGLAVDELQERGKRAAGMRANCGALRAPRRPVVGEDVQPMLAEPRSDPFDDRDWFFELKYDGFRSIVSRDGARPRIFYRRGADATAVFPDLARALLALPAERFIADGEIAVLDDTARPVFQRLQKRALLTAPRDVERAATELPATLFLFDLLAFEDFDLRPLPLIERKKLLLQLVPAAGPIRAVDYVEGQGRALYASVRELGLEGIVAKRAQSAYRSGRFRDWQKIRIDRVGDFAVVGFTRAEGSRTGFGSVHVAVQKTEGLVYVGRVGGGFSEKELTSARAELEALRLDRPPCIGPLPGGRGHTWVQPKLVVEVRYKEITEDGLLRQPTFLRFRSDKVPAECIEPGAPPVTLLPREVPFSNLDKVFWPEEGYTKGDLIDYYRAVSPWLLPYLRDRPVVLTRYPDGIAGKSFFQKDAPDYVPAWVRTARVWSEEGGRDIDFFVCEDVDTLLYVINLGTIPLHLWASRMAKPQHPDWSIIDLDPKTAPFEDVVTLANAVHELCEEIGLPSFCKTSGQKGLHVLLPVGGQLTHAQSTTLAELIARAVEARFPRIATIERHIPSRKGRVYLDYLQNGHGKTIAGPFSARPVQGATVSMPLKWSEVNGKLDPRKFTLKTAPARMKKLREDPLQLVLELSPDLQAALARLADKLT